jgi:hypothetical protein
MLITKNFSKMSCGQRASDYFTIFIWRLSHFGHHKDMTTFYIFQIKLSTFFLPENIGQTKTPAIEIAGV